MAVGNNRGRNEEEALPQRIEELFNEHGVRIYNLLLRLTGNRDDAADLTQEVFLRARKGLERFEKRSSERTWLIRIAVNAGRDHLRRRRREPGSFEAALASGAVDEPEAPVERADRALEEAEARRMLSATLADLEPDARAVLLLRETHGLSYQELAEALGVPLGTVQSRLSRARWALRRAILRRYPDWRP